MSGPGDTPERDRVADNMKFAAIVGGELAKLVPDDADRFMPTKLIISKVFEEPRDAEHALELMNEIEFDGRGFIRRPESINYIAAMALHRVNEITNPDMLAARLSWEYEGYGEYAIVFRDPELAHQAAVNGVGVIKNEQ